MNELEKRPTDFIFGIILHLRTVIQINIIYFCLGKRDTGSGPLYPIMGFGQITVLASTTADIILTTLFIPYSIYPLYYFEALILTESSLTGIF